MCGIWKTQVLNDLVLVFEGYRDQNWVLFRVALLKSESKPEEIASRTTIFFFGGGDRILLCKINRYPSCFPEEYYCQTNSRYNLFF